MKVYNIQPGIAVLLMILIFFGHSVGFTCSKVINFQVTEFMDRHVSKALNLIFPKPSMQNMHSFGYARILIRSCPQSSLGMPGTMTHLLCYKYEEK